MSKVTTKSAVRLSYAALITPKAIDDKSPELYSTSILIPKSDTETVEAIKAAVKEALSDGKTKLWAGKMPPPTQLRNPLRDGDAERPDDEVYAGHYFLNAKGPKGGKEAPILLDSKGQETASDSVVYSGVFARVSIQFFPYDKSGNKGVGASLSAVQSQETGDPLGNAVTVGSARNEFGITTPATSAAADFSNPGDSSSEAAESGDDEDPWGA